ncbi:hypothetical protein pEaSNUABM54_00282 [Erwinia phage pEa_SNUABM_54]|nr:hypothetical protein pEaSNUABM54_00282 [Erwinia phage pEa_SNUABM_54]
MERPYPSLSTKGWLEDVPGVLDAVMTNFFLTHPSLSVEFKNAIYSLPDLIQKYGNNETDIKREVRDAMETLFSRWFDKVTAECSVTYPDPDDDIRMNVSVYLTIDHKGETYNVARELSMSGSKLMKVMEINNG